jgi:hypothetical protein
MGNLSAWIHSGEKYARPMCVPGSFGRGISGAYAYGFQCRQPSDSTDRTVTLEMSFPELFTYCE